MSADYSLIATSFLALSDWMLPLKHYEDAIEQQHKN
jgi:hypothetical protein